MTPQLCLAKAEQVSALRSLIFTAFKPLAERMNKVLPDDAWSNLGAYVEARNLYIYQQDGDILGLLCVSDKNDDLCVDTLAVRPDLQGQGLGKKLMQEAELIAESRGSRTLSLHTPEVMHELLAFYQRLGFQEIKRALPEHGNDSFLRVHFIKAIAHNGLHMDPVDEHDRLPL